VNVGRTVAGTATAALVAPGTMVPMITAPAAAQESGGGTRNAILYLGDGMGQAQRDAGQPVSLGFTRTLAMDSLPVAGMFGTAAAGDETGSG